MYYLHASLGKTMSRALNSAFQTIQRVQSAISLPNSHHFHDSVRYLNCADTDQRTVGWVRYNYKCRYESADSNEQGPSREWKFIARWRRPRGSIEAVIYWLIIGKMSLNVRWPFVKAYSRWSSSMEEDHRTRRPAERAGLSGNPLLVVVKFQRTT